MDAATRQKPLEESRMRVLIVDDSAVLRKRLKKILALVEGIEVIGEAWDATEATDSIWRLRPELVVLDVQLAHGTGLDVLHNIQGTKWKPWVIVLTNYPYPEFRSKYLQAGADYFFDKATEFEKLISTAAQLIRREPAANSALTSASGQEEAT